MRLKFTTALMALFFLMVAAWSGFAQTNTNAGWNVSQDATLPTLVFGGNNQRVGALIFDHQAVGARQGEPPILENDETGTPMPPTTITISYGGLPITNADASAFLWCGETAATPPVGIACGQNTAPNDDTTDDPTATLDKKKNTITIEIPHNSDQSFTLAYVRVDVSSLADKAKVAVSITPGAKATVPLGGGTVSGASGNVGMIAIGLTATAAPAQGLVCSDTQALPTLTVKEGFDNAWNPGDDAGSPARNDVLIKVTVGNFPSTGTLTWQDSYDALQDLDLDGEGNDKATKDQVVGTLSLQKGMTSANGQTAVFKYARKDVTYDNDATRKVPGGTGTELIPGVDQADGLAIPNV